MVRMAKGKTSPYDGLIKLHRDGYAAARWTGKVVIDPRTLAKPLSWRKPRRIFVNSMSDLFHESLANEEIAAVFGVMAACPQHTFQILTKRAKRMSEWFEWVTSTHFPRPGVPPGEHVCELIQRYAAGATSLSDGFPVLRRFQWPLPNVWLGVSVENQDAADERIPDLLATPAAVRFLSVEPMIGPVRLHAWLGREHGLRQIGAPPGIHWVIAGCESGPGARPCDVEWLRPLRDQCAAAEVPFFLKQAKLGGGSFADFVSGSVKMPGIWLGPESHRKPGGIIGLPYLDGVQHAAFPKRNGEAK